MIFVSLPATVLKIADRHKIIRVGGDQENDPRIGSVEILVAIEFLSVGIQNGERRIERRPGATGLHFENQVRAFPSFEFKEIRLRGLANLSRDADRQDNFLRVGEQVLSTDLLNLRRVGDAKGQWVGNTRRRDDPHFARAQGGFTANRQFGRDTLADIGRAIREKIAAGGFQTNGWPGIRAGDRGQMFVAAENKFRNRRQVFARQSDVHRRAPLNPFRRYGIEFGNRLGGEREFKKREAENQDSGRDPAPGSTCLGQVQCHWMFDVQCSRFGIVRIQTSNLEPRMLNFEGRRCRQHPISSHPPETGAARDFANFGRAHPKSAVTGSACTSSRGCWR